MRQRLHSRLLPYFVAVPVLATSAELSDFLKSVERRAFKRTAYHVRDDDAALDIVQDSMMKLAEHYGHKPVDELPMLFQRILTNTMLDWFRRQKVRNALFSSFSDFQSDSEQDDFDIQESLTSSEPGTGPATPDAALSQQQLLLTIEAELLSLPARQREAFLLRYWEELDTAETAAVMGCSEGSVKTHCSRALHSLTKALTSKGIQP